MIETYTQVECCPELNQKKLTKFCKERDIVLIAYSPLGHPKENIRHPNFIYDDKVLQIAKKHNKTAPQIVLRFLVSRKTHRNDKNITYLSLITIIVVITTQNLLLAHTVLL